jgi:hypothetical protein
MSCIKKCIPLASKKCPFPLLSLALCHTPHLFLNEIIKNEALNKIVYSMMKKGPGIA